MYLITIVKKIFKRLYYIIYFNRRKAFQRFLTFYSINKNPKFFRPGSKPYLSGDTLRRMCDHIFDETSTLDPKKIKENDFIFLKTDLVSIFFENYHIDIDNKYNLISTNSDTEIGKELTNYADEKINAWFTQNLLIKSQKNIFPLAVGIENKRYLTNGITNNFRIQYSEDDKKLKLLASFNVGTNYEERKKLMDVASKISIIEIRNFNNHKEYIKSLSKYKFNLCPHGNGIDTHRIWETLLVNSIPVLLNTSFAQNFKEIGVPMLLVNKWEDLLHLSEAELNNFYIEKKKVGDFRKYSTFSFWKNYIELKSSK